MATITLHSDRIRISGNDRDRSRALKLPGSNWAKAGHVTMPLNVLSWYLLSSSFPESSHDYSEEILAWRHIESEITEFGRLVNDQELEVWDQPDMWEWQAQAKARLAVGSVAFFDDRGMGKTRVVVEAIRESQSEGECSAVILTGRKIRRVWSADAAMWWGPEHVCVPQAGRWSDAADQIGSATITVLTYESILNPDIQKAIKKLDPEWLIMDEAHNLKKRARKNKKKDEDGNPIESTSTKSGVARSLPGRRRVVLTGTPMPNRWHEVWTLLNFVAPKTFTSFWQFVEVLGQVRESFWGGKEISEDVFRTDIWNEIFDRWTIRRERPDDGKVWDFVPVELSKREADAYAKMAKDMRVEKDNGEVLDAATGLAQLTRLQQLAGGLGEWETKEAEDGRLVSTYRHANPSSKVDRLLEMTEGLDRAVVFTRFRNRAEFVAGRIEKETDLTPLLITGGISERASNRALKSFSDPSQGPFVAVCVFGTISEGINELVSARDIFFLDWTTVKDVTQAADRLDRPGQKSHMVRCVTLFAEGTVDEAAIDREAGKVKPLRSILRSPEAWSFLPQK